MDNTPRMSLSAWQDRRCIAYALFVGRVDAIRQMLAAGAHDAARAVEALETADAQLRHDFALINAEWHASDNEAAS